LESNSDSLAVQPVAWSLWRPSHFDCLILMQVALIKQCSRRQHRSGATRVCLSCQRLRATWRGQILVPCVHAGATAAPRTAPCKYHLEHSRDMNKAIIVLWRTLQPLGATRPRKQHHPPPRPVSCRKVTWVPFLARIPKILM
jgi:hypothetical protein